MITLSDGSRVTVTQGYARLWSPATGELIDILLDDPKDPIGSIDRFLEAERAALQARIDRLARWTVKAERMKDAIRRHERGCRVCHERWKHAKDCTLEAHLGRGERVEDAHREPEGTEP